MPSNLPPGVTDAMIERHFDPGQCECCGRHADDCICPECPVCGQAGNPYCYDHGHLKPTYEQVLGAQRARIARAQDNLDTEKMYLQWLESHPEEISNFEFGVA